MIYCLAYLQARRFLAELFCLFGPVLWIRDVFPVSEFFLSQIRIQGQKGIGTLDPGYGSALKN